MKVTYNKNQDNASQIITVSINANIEDVFYYIGTNSGIQSWFPQLTFIGENAKPEELHFDLGEGDVEKMHILSYEKNKKLSYTWDVGDVSFELEDTNGKTKLIFKENLPLKFGNVSQDLTGWYFQIKNIKSVVETGKQEEIDMDDFKKQQTNVMEELEL